MKLPRIIPPRWRATYITIGLGAPVFTEKIVRARSLHEALREAQAHRLEGTRLDDVKMIQPRFRRLKFRKLTAAGIFLLGVAASSPWWADPDGPATAQFVRERECLTGYQVENC